MWKILVYATLVGVGLWATVGEYWFWDTKGYWSECSRLPCEAPTLPRVRCWPALCQQVAMCPPLYWQRIAAVKPLHQVKLLYLLELAYYAQELPMLFVWFTKRKDFGQMVAHHIATLGLIAYSLELGCVVPAHVCSWRIWGSWGVGMGSNLCAVGLLHGCIPRAPYICLYNSTLFIPGCTCVSNLVTQVDARRFDHFHAARLQRPLPRSRQAHALRGQQRRQLGHVCCLCGWVVCDPAVAVSHAGDPQHAL